jgi:lysophospholipase L1-like esterase
LVAGLALGATACSDSDDSGDSAATTAATSAATTSSAPPATTAITVPTTLATTTTTAPGPRYYVSLGDSYASGWEPGVGNTTNGFAYQVADGAATAGTPLELVNFGCAGATTTSILTTAGCPAEALGPGATPYDGQTQADAAEAFLRAHPGEVELITVSIGGNDVTRCGVDPDPVACVGTAVGSINQNLPVLLQRLRATAGADTLIVGTTYPDVILGEWVSGAPNGQQLATLSVTAFQAIINPALQAAYTAAGAEFVDVTAASGAYGALTDLTPVAPYGNIPVPVAKVCELTYYCEQRDIHPRAAGYELIADLVLQVLAAGQ